LPLLHNKRIAYDDNIVMGRLNLRHNINVLNDMMLIDEQP